MKPPATLAVAFNWVALSAVPAEIGAGAGQVTTGVALLTVSCTEAVAAEYVFVSVGVKVTESVWVPPLGTVPAAGL